MINPCRKCSKIVAVRSHGTVTKECCLHPGDLEEARQQCEMCAYTNLIEAVAGRDK